MAFSKSFTKQLALPDASIAAANRVLVSADLHRYQGGSEEFGEVSLLEQEYASWQGARYCLALASGGQAMQLAMRAVGVMPGDPVLTNAFTLAPVPGAIRAVGADPVLVEITESLVIDLEDLKEKARSSGARILLLSHMRGHLVDMDELSKVAQQLSLLVIEDCAHTMGAKWRDERSGNFGKVACFSTQSYKHLNSGEGGFLTSDDPDVMARAIILSGSYMNYARHGAAPSETYFADAKFDVPNMSARMDALRAAILRPQLAELDSQVENWGQRCTAIEGILSASPHIHLPTAAKHARRVGSSVQLCIPSLDETGCKSFLASAARKGLDLKWFGRSEPAGFTSAHFHWRYVAPQSLAETDRILATLFDMRIPLTFSIEDCHCVASLLCETAHELLREAG